MLAPEPILHDQPSPLGDVRQALSLRPALADYSAKLAKHLEGEEQEVRECLAVLRVEDEVLV